MYWVQEKNKIFIYNISTNTYTSMSHEGNFPSNTSRTLIINKQHISTTPHPLQYNIIIQHQNNLRCFLFYETARDRASAIWTRPNSHDTYEKEKRIHTHNIAERKPTVPFVVDVLLYSWHWAYHGQYLEYKGIIFLFFIFISWNWKLRRIYKEETSGNLMCTSRFKEKMWKFIIFFPRE